MKRVISKNSWKPHLINKKCTKMVCLLLVFVVFSSMVKTVDMSVIWTQSTDPVIIGGNLTLFCNTSEDSCSLCTSRWLIANSILSFNDVVKDPNKYAVNQVKDGFILMIKNLTIADFNANYVCSYGFSSYTKNLTLPASFLVYPRKDTVMKNIFVTQRTLLLDVIFKEIHPVPFCDMHLDGENLSSAVQLTTEKIGYLYDVKMKLHHTVRPDQCKGKLLVYCRIGTKNDTIVNQTLTFECNGAGESTESEIVWITLGITLLTFFVAVIMVVIKLLEVIRRSNRMIKNEVICRKNRMQL